MKSLSLIYKGSLGKTHTLKLKYAKDGLDAQTVRTSMQRLASTNLFKKDEEVLFEKPVCAKYVTTTEEVIFDDRKNSKDNKEKK